MNRYTLQSNGWILDEINRTWPDPQEFWYQELATGDIWSLCQIITQIEETEGESRRLVLFEDMVLGFSDMKPGDMPLAVPVRETFIPPINTSYLTLTDKDGREVAAYRANGCWVDVMFGGVSHRINFLKPRDFRSLSVADLEGNGDDDKLDKLKTFMRAMVAAAQQWED